MIPRLGIVDFSPSVEHIFYVVLVIFYNKKGKPFKHAHWK